MCLYSQVKFYLLRPTKSQSIVGEGRLVLLRGTSFVLTKCCLRVLNKACFVDDYTIWGIHPDLFRQCSPRLISIKSPPTASLIVYPQAHAMLYHKVLLIAAAVAAVSAKDDPHFVTTVRLVENIATSCDNFGSCTTTSWVMGTIG